MNKVAIIIPTKNRLDFVIRTIQYYASINSPHPIFIGDASDRSSEEIVLNAAQNKIEIFYFHWENLGDRKTLSKLAQEASKTNITDYCAFHGDDDFFVSESLSKCAEFLDDNPAYATSQGRAFSFELNEDGAYGKLKDVGIYWNLKELKGDTALDRLKEISANYWVPNFSDANLTKLGSSTAAVLILTLSAPDLSKAFISSKVLTPPPTVRGIKHFSAVFLTVSNKIFLFSFEAVMSRKHNSSAPCSSYILACSTGSPASTKSTKLIPLTTLPFFTSKQGIILFFNILYLFC